MALSKRRLVKLEARFGVGTGMFAPHRDELDRESVTAEAMRRLTLVELEIFEGLMHKRARHADISGAEFFGMMSPLEHTFESEWTRIVRGVLRDRIEETDATRERKAELQRRADEAARMETLCWPWVDEPRRRLEAETERATS